MRRRIKVPIVSTFHDLLVPYLFPKAGPLRWKVVEYLARRSDAVIVTNEEDRARLSVVQRAELFPSAMRSAISPRRPCSTSTSRTRIPLTGANATDPSNR